MTDRQPVEEQQSDRPGMISFGDVETAIRHEVEFVAERFPDTDIATVERTVRDVYAELSAKADVDTHVLSLTRQLVVDRLEEQGQTYRPPATTEPESDA